MRDVDTAWELMCRCKSFRKEDRFRMITQPFGKAGTARKIPLQPLADGQNISLRILEPGGPRASSRCDIVFHDSNRQIVFLKLYAAGS